MSDRDHRIEEALRLLHTEVRERLERHPAARRPVSPETLLDLRIALPLGAGSERLGRAAAATRQRLKTALQELIALKTAMRPGRVYCLRCRSAGCEHASPRRAREVFAGYGSTGMPRFLDFGQWLLDRRDPRVDQLFDERPKLVARQVPGRELLRRVLPVYRDGGHGYRLHGQVCAGWFMARHPDGPPEPFAATFQLLSTRSEDQPRRFAWNLLASSPRREELDTLLDRLDEVPWAAPLGWAQAQLAQVERDSQSGARSQRGRLQRRLEGLLEGLARRLEKGSRARRRRTRHAEERHREGIRPTRSAVADLARADPDQLLFDTRNETVIVLGERNRAHAFSLEGKLVTSIYTTPTSVSRRTTSGLWRPASPEEVAQVQERLSAAMTQGDG